MREGVFRCGNERFRCSLVDLPHNVETYTTGDKVNYYKSADIGCAACVAAHTRLTARDRQMVLVPPHGARSNAMAVKRGTFEALDGLTGACARATADPPIGLTRTLSASHAHWSRVQRR